MKTYLATKCKMLMNKLREKDGGDYVGTGVQILIAVVVGALLLYGLYSVFGDVVLPTLVERITDMFDYKGGSYTP